MTAAPMNFIFHLTHTLVQQVQCHLTRGSTSDSRDLLWTSRVAFREPDAESLLDPEALLLCSPSASVATFSVDAGTSCVRNAGSSHCSARRRERSRRVGIGRTRSRGRLASGRFYLKQLLPPPLFGILRRRWRLQWRRQDGRFVQRRGDHIVQRHDHTRAASSISWAPMLSAASPHCSISGRTRDRDRACRRTPRPRASGEDLPARYLPAAQTDLAVEFLLQPLPGCLGRLSRVAVDTRRFFRGVERLRERGAIGPD